MLDGQSIFDYYIVDSQATRSDDVGTGDARYSFAQITDKINNTTVRVAKDDLYSIWRVGDRVKVSTSDYDVFSITSVTEIDASTIELEIDHLDFITVNVGDTISSSLDTPLTANEAVSFWIEMIIKIGVSINSDFDSVNINVGA